MLGNVRKCEKCTNMWKHVETCGKMWEKVENVKNSIKCENIVEKCAENVEQMWKMRENVKMWKK